MVTLGGCGGRVGCGVCEAGAAALGGQLRAALAALDVPSRRCSFRCAALVAPFSFRASAPACVLSWKGGFVIGRRRASASFFAVLLAALASACGEASRAPTFEQSAEGFTAYLGVVPSAVVAAHAPAHPERKMHSGDRGNAHVLVSIFDGAGARVEDAAVDAVLRAERHGGGRRIRLRPMRIEGAVTYGAFVNLAANDRYHLDIAIRRGHSQHETRMRFLFDAPSLADGTEPS
jgi:hypothetical protein